MTRFINSKVKAIPPSGIRRFFDIAESMPDAISLGVGEPDFITPWSIRDASIKSMQRGNTQYTSNRGLPELCRLISQYLQRFGLSYNPSKEIIVTVGASEAIDLTLRAVIESGDEVLIPEPCYVSYAPLVSICGGVPVAVPVDAQNEFKLTADSLKKVITPKCKLLIFAYPNNPTGAIMTREEMLPIVNEVISADLCVLSDEIYAELTYDGTHNSIAEIEGMRERTILVSGFSKAFAMTGFRLGYLCAPADVASLLIKIHQYAIMCAPTFSQYGAVEALRRGFADGFKDVEYMRSEYDMRRRYLLSAFRDMGLECFEPKGAFYLFPSVQRLGLNGEQFAERLLIEGKVAVVPGSAFGSGCANHFRACYAVSLKQLRRAVESIGEFVSVLDKNRGLV